MTSRARNRRRGLARAGAAGCALVALAGCAQTAGPDGDDRAEPPARPGTTASATTGPTAAPLRRLSGARINIAEGQTVGVGMPISVTFSHPVPSGQRADAERQLKVDTDVEGSWSWVKDRNLLDGQRIDFRPRTYWKPGTRVTVHAGSGTTRHFTVGRSLIATVDVRTHTMRIVRDGATRTVPITAGAPGMDTWNGTMVVSDKATKVFMDSQTVGYGDAYAGYYHYAVHLTASGTYLHQNPKADTFAGRANVTHGCVGLATDGTAKHFYEEVIPGDVVKVVGSKETVAPGNGYGDWNVDWARWRAGSALT
ncbi:Ig-like domain-containing protein [Streptomyces sp. NPDC006314]|uniref:Ig-like domain-containing protein n=1 Tax=Streptomyces sp. NPDC006314 TaxID=3154475 RepID=UPI0033A30185